jgi:hypothetical protein
MTQDLTPAAFEAEVLAMCGATTQPRATADTITLPTTKTKLAKVDRVIQQQQSIGAMMVEAGEYFGAFFIVEHENKVALEHNLQDVLRRAKAAGLTIAMLKAGQECYSLFVTTINEIRQANGMKELSPAVRDNYLSKIRRFVNGDDKFLDLYNNKAVKVRREVQKKEAATKPAPHAVGNEAIDASKESARSKVEFLAKSKDMRGAGALAAFLAEWIEENDSTMALLLIREMAQDLLAQCNVMTGAKK